jgi:hypothetical protein
MTVRYISAFPARLVLAAALALAAAAPSHAQALPTTIGDCGDSTIKTISGRFENDPDFTSGTVVTYDNGLIQISYEREEGAVTSRVGDAVRICLASIPQGCPPGDDRGRIYVTTNLRTGAKWEMPDSQHMCGGA